MENIVVQPCPCRYYQTIEAIERVLESPERVESLIKWISGRYHEEATSKNTKLSCPNYCKQRVPTSLLILNSIRDACRLFLEKRAAEPLKPQAEKASYEDEFPSLALGTPKNAPKENPKKAKKRIRPVVLSTQDTAWSQKGNLVNVGEATALPPKISDKSFQTETRKDTSISTSSAFVTPRKEDSSMDRLVKADKVTPTSARNIFAASDTPAKDEALQALVSIYSLLIRKCLVPSTLLEVHFLLRLLHVDEGINLDEQDGGPLRAIFRSSSSCRAFASSSLESLSQVLQGLGPVTENLLQLDRFRQLVPNASRDIEQILKNQPKMVAVHITHTNTAFLTLPFDEKRDSRHNFKSKEEQAVFKNREETRDAFLYQLRAFLGIRGKIVDASQHEKSLQKIQQGSRTVVEAIRNENLNWFCEFFVELLIQIGPVPLQELDKDLLKLTDKDKLQKLHKRFTSKAPSATKDSRRIATSTKRDSKSDPFATAQESFSGHQEFFYLFLVHSDSHRLSSHLKHHIWKYLRSICKPEIFNKDPDKLITESKVLGRFLGLLIFAPTWGILGVSHSKALAYSIEEELVRLDIDVIEFLRSKDASSLPCMIWWLLDFLRMATWSVDFTQTSTFSRITGIVRALQQSLAMTERTSSTSIGIAIQFDIESFFADYIGLPRVAHNLSNAMHFEGLSDLCMANDCCVSMVSTWFMVNAHFEEVTALASKLRVSCLSEWKSPGITRKLRPSAVRIDSSPFSPQKGYQESEPSPLPVSYADSAIETRLGEAFFHRHQTLREICEFVISRSLVSLRETLQSTVLPPVQTSEGIAIAKLIEETSGTLLESFSTKLRASIRVILTELAPAPNDSALIELSIDLAYKHGRRMGSVVIGKFVRSGIESRIRGIEDAKDLFGSTESGKDDIHPGTESLFHFLLSTEELIAALKSDSTVSDIDGYLRRCSERLRIFLAASEGGGDAVLEKDWRSFYTGLLNLDPILCSWLKMHSVECSFVYASVIELVTYSSSISSYGLRRTHIQLNSE